MIVFPTKIIVENTYYSQLLSSTLTNSVVGVFMRVSAQNLLIYFIFENTIKLYGSIAFLYAFNPIPLTKWR